MTLYPDEKEILLQAGLLAKVVRFKEEKGMIVFELESSEKMIRSNNLFIFCCYWLSLSVAFLSETIETVLVLTCLKEKENHTPNDANF